MKKIKIKYILIIVASIIIASFYAFRIGDFNVFLGAAKLLTEHKQIYNVWIEQKPGNYCLYFYSPLFALILIPFTYLPFYLVNFLWLFINCILFYRIIHIIHKFLLVNNNLPSKINFVIIFLSVISILRFLLNNFEMAQMTVFLLWASLESISLFDKKQTLLGAFLLALAINIKIMPIVLLPYFIYRKYFKETIFVLAFMFIFIILPAFFLGWNFNLSLHKSWLETINPFSYEHTFGETTLSTHSLTSLIPSLFMNLPGSLNIKRNIANFDFNTVLIILNSVRFILIFMTVLFLNSYPFKTSKSNIHTFYEISYIFLITPLIFPHQQKYNFIFLLPATTYLIHFVFYDYFKMKKLSPKSFIIIVFLLTYFILSNLTTDGIVGKNLSDLLQHFKVLTYGVIILIIPLFMCKPDKINQLNTQIQNNPYL